MGGMYMRRARRRAVFGMGGVGGLVQGSQAQAAQALARMSRGGYERDYGEGGRAYL